jgi:phosphomethylpyrimidine synthase
MCGHDWCSVRISKEIQEWASGKAEGYVPLKVATKSPGLTPEQAALLAHRGKGSAGVPPVKHACHSDNVADAEAAKQVQSEYVRMASDGES